jgi:hypothetical protein
LALAIKLLSDHDHDHDHDHDGEQVLVGDVRRFRRRMSSLRA